MTRRSSTVAVAATPSDWPGWPSSAASGQSTPGGRSGSVPPTPPPRQRVRMFPRKRPPRNARAGGGRRRAGVAAAASAATPAACPRRPRRSQVQYMRLRRRAQPPASARCTAGVPVGWRQRQVATVADGRPTTSPVGAIAAAVPAAAPPPPPRWQRRKAPTAAPGTRWWRDGGQASRQRRLRGPIERPSRRRVESGRGDEARAAAMAAANAAVAAPVRPTRGTHERGGCGAAAVPCPHWLPRSGAGRAPPPLAAATVASTRGEGRQGNAAAAVCSSGCDARRRRQHPQPLVEATGGDTRTSGLSPSQRRARHACQHRWRWWR